MRCYNLTTITIPSNVTDIVRYAFADCYSLTEFEIPSNVTNIGYGAFIDCSNLCSITIRENVKSIGEYAFAWNSSFENVYYMGSKERWNDIIIDSKNSYLTEATIHYNYVPEE
jgi:hypothetical protein